MIAASVVVVLAHNTVFVGGLGHGGAGRTRGLGAPRFELALVPARETGARPENTKAREKKTRSAALESTQAEILHRKALVPRVGAALVNGGALSISTPGVSLYSQQQPEVQGTRSEEDFAGYSL